MNGAVALERVIGTTCEVQVVAVVLQPVDEAYTIGLAGVVVEAGSTVKEIASDG